MKKLTVKQEKFVVKLFECGNASEAYRHAYSTKNMKDESINNKAYQLSKRVDIRARLETLQKQAEKEAGWNVAKVLQHYSEVIEIGLGRKSSKHMVTEGSGDGMSETIEVDMHNTNLPAVNTALTNIAKHLGMFTQKVEMSGELSLKDLAKKIFEENND